MVLCVHRFPRHEVGFRSVTDPRCGAPAQSQPSTSSTDLDGSGSVTCNLGSVGWLRWYCSALCAHSLTALANNRSHSTCSQQTSRCAGGRHNISPPPASNWPCDLDLWPFDLESGFRVTCDVGYLCANFSLLRPLCYQLSPDVRDRKTDRRQTASSLNAPAY